jgi:thiol:disulfide interchange protein DsbA
MNPTRRTLLTAAAALAALGARVPAYAQAPQVPVAGRDYAVLNPTLPVDSQGKIEVLEFFWYGCIHCYNLEPVVEVWLRSLPPDVEFRRIPAIFNDRWKLDANIYYAFEAMGLTDKTHAPLFHAIHKSRLQTTNQGAFNDWLKKEGIDQTKFEEAFKSFGVQSKVRRALQLTAAYRIDGTPQLAVHGTYTITVDQGKTAPGMFAIADHLVGLARKNPGAKR